MKYGNAIIARRLLCKAIKYPYSEKDAEKIGKKIGASEEEIARLRQGMNVEHEHDQDSETNVAHGRHKIVAKIALAHLREMLDYYDKLKTIEKGNSQFQAYASAYSDFSNLANNDTLRNLDTLQDQYLEATGIDHNYANQVLDQIKKTVVPLAKQYNQTWDKYSQIIAAPRLMQFGLNRLDENDFDNPMLLARGHFRNYGKALNNFKNFLSGQLTQPRDNFAKADRYETQPGKSLLDVMHRVLKFNSEHPPTPQPIVTPEDKNRHEQITHIHSLRETPETESPFIGGDTFDKALSPQHHQSILSQLEGKNEDELRAGGILGDRLGEGLYRRVYSLKQYPGLVVKIPLSDRSIENNKTEYQHYQKFRDSGAKKYVAPIYGITSNGISLAKRVDPLPKDVANQLDRLDILSNPMHEARLKKIVGLGVDDVHSGNFGIDRGKLVSLDYNKAIPDPLDTSKDVELVDQSLEHLDPDFSEMILSLIDRARDFGLELYIREGFRTRARQQYLSDVVNAQGAGVAPPIYTQEGMIDFDERTFPHGAGFAVDIGIKGLEQQEDAYHAFLHKLWAAMYPGKVNPDPIPDDFNHYEASKEFIDKNSRDLTESDHYGEFMDIFSKARRAIAGKSRAWGDILHHYIRDIHTPGLDNRSVIPVDKYKSILANAISYHIRNHRPGAHEYEQRTPEETKIRTSLFHNLMEGKGLDDRYLSDLDPAHDSKIRALQGLVNETNWSSRDDLEKLERNVTRLNNVPSAPATASSPPPGALPISEFLNRNKPAPQWTPQALKPRPVVDQALLDRLTSNTPGQDFIDANKQAWKQSFAKPVQAMAQGVEGLGRKMGVIKATYVDQIKERTAQDPYESAGLNQGQISDLVRRLSNVSNPVPRNMQPLLVPQSTPEPSQDPYEAAGLEKKKISDLVQRLLNIRYKEPENILQPETQEPTSSSDIVSTSTDTNDLISQAESDFAPKPRFMSERSYNQLSNRKNVRPQFAEALAPQRQSRIMEGINAANTQRRQQERFNDVLNRDIKNTLQGDTDYMPGPEFRGKVGYLSRMMDKKMKPVEGKIVGAPETLGGNPQKFDIYSTRGIHRMGTPEIEKIYQGVNDLASKSEIAFDQ
jgi:hypothetical protein